MTTSRINFAALILVTFTIGIVSCTQQQAQQQAPQQPAQSAAPAAQPAAPPAPTAPADIKITPTATGLGSNQYSANAEIRCDLLEVKRVSGNAVLVRWRVVNAGATNAHYTYDWKDIYYIDPAENKRYSFLTDSDGNKILDVKYGGMKPGEQWLGWAKFPAPPAASAKISISIGGFAPFEDVPLAP